MQLRTECFSATPTAVYVAPATTSIAGVRLRVCNIHDPDRDEVERFIRDVYARMYGARVRQPMPRLLAFRDRANTLVGAVGLRNTAGGALFLESYLDAPAERCIAERTAISVHRTSVVEIGNLALTTAGYARSVIRTVIAFLRDAGIEWVVFTAVTTLRNACHRLGLEPIYLATADPARLGAQAADWGSYYEAHPAVFAGRVADGVARLESRPGRDHSSRRLVRRRRGGSYRR